MSDECLITLETVFSFYTQYQAVMQKFTLAGKASLNSALAATNVVNYQLSTKRIDNFYNFINFK